MAKGKSTTKRAGTKKNNSKNQGRSKTSTQRTGSRTGQNSTPTRGNQLNQTFRNNITGLILLAVGIFLIVALQTTAAGIVGEKLGELLKGLLGFGAFLLPYLLILYAILIFAKLASRVNSRTMILLFVLYLMVDIINGLRFIDPQGETMEFANVYADGVVLKGGGIIGFYVGNFLVKAIGIYGAYIVVILVTIICLLIILNTPISRLLELRADRKERQEEINAQIEEEKRQERIKEEELKILNAMKRTYVPKEKANSNKGKPYLDNPFDRNKKEKLEPLTKTEEPQTANMPPEEDLSKKGFEFSFLKRQRLNEEAQVETQEQSRDEQKETTVKERKIEKRTRKEKEEIEEIEIDSGEQKQFKSYKAPPIGLLQKSKLKKKESLSESAKEKALILERTLTSFGVDATVVDVTEGPSVTRYEIQPAIGVKVSSIVRLSDDLALNLRAKTMRIEAPIPGKAAVGIEIENGERELVTIGDIVATRTFQNHPSNIAFAVGRDIEGTSIVADMQKMPHLLIAGATGAGKSVCINTIIASLLYKSSPEEVRLVLIDPKMVELGNYNGIPHLLIPVVTDPKKAAAALNWAVGEMTDRYKRFAETGTKNITTYNEKMKKDGEEEKVLPQIVIVIDELADLMMVASSVVEDAICRLAQMARAAGMHLIVATQRPSVDVITGLIKANIPSRIAFMVSSQIDSRTIIDMAGAEKLVGNGDMLFKTADKDKPVRIQCPFISESEVKKVIKYIVENNSEEVEYEEEVIEKIEKGNQGMGEDFDQSDELLNDAALAVISAGQASVSMLQRRFRIGYNRAARLVDELESLGVIGPSEGSKPRQVLLNQLEWDDLREEMED